MNVFTVTKPGGTKDYEFEAYTRLLEDIGVDVANVPRVPEPETSRRWLYTWRLQGEAEGFAHELKKRMRDGSWHVHRFEMEAEDRGPVAPLDIYVGDEDHGTMYYLSPASRERIIKAYPHTKLHPLTIVRAELKRIQDQYGDTWWDQVPVLLTRLMKDQILALGGYRVIQTYGVIGHEELPPIPSQG